MTTPLRLPLAAALLGLSLAACGAPSRSAAAVRWMHAKPSSIVASLRAAVVERPAPDRARIEAHWTARQAGAGCALRLVLPPQVLLVEGAASPPLDPDLTVGEATWLVQFPTGQPLDAVIRYCADTPDGLRAAEVAVRLTP